MLVWWPYGDDRDMSWIRGHLRVIQDQLGSIEHALRGYREERGRYPTNDEGLSVLDNFESRFKLTYYEDPVTGRSDSGTSWPPAFDPSWLLMNRAAIRKFRATHGRVPSSAREFRDNTRPCRSFDRDVGLPQDREPVEIELAIGKGGHIFILSPAGVLSPWLLPYMYENRIGQDPGLFMDSPAEKDAKGRYSVEVDQGVYVYSIGGALYSAKYRRMWWKRHGPRLFGCGLIVACAVIAITLRLRSGSKAFSSAGLLAIVASLLGGGGFRSLNVATCYIMAPLFYRRDPEALQQQIVLLDKFRARGVLGEEAYRKAMAAAEGESGQQTERPELQE